MSDKETTTVTSKDSKITIGLAVLLLGTFSSGTFWLKDELSTTNTQLLLMDARLQGIERGVDTKYAYLEGYVDREIDSVKKELQDVGKDRIYRHEIKSWIQVLEASNDTIHVPSLPGD